MEGEHLAPQPALHLISSHLVSHGRARAPEGAITSLAPNKGTANETRETLQGQKTPHGHFPPEAATGQRAPYTQAGQGKRQELLILLLYKEWGR